MLLDIALSDRYYIEDNVGNDLNLICTCVCLIQCLISFSR